MISELWIKQYVDKMLDLARRMPDGPLRESCLRRAEHAMDLVEAWRKRNQPPKEEK